MHALVVGTSEVVAALHGLLLALRTLMLLHAALLNLLDGTGMRVRLAQLVAIAGEDDWVVRLREVVHYGSIGRFGNGAAMEVLVAKR